MPRVITPSAAALALAASAAKSKSSKTLPNLAVDALAGTGKTTTIVEAVRILKGEKSKLKPSPQQQAIWEEICRSPKDSTVGMTSFGKAIADELGERMPKVEGVFASTNHAFGNRAIKASFDKVFMDKRMLGDWILGMTGLEFGDFAKTYPGLFGVAKKMVSLSKSELLGFDGEELLAQNSPKWGTLIQQLCEHHAIEFEREGYFGMIAEWVPNILHKSINVMAKLGKYTMDDMIWVPVVMKLNIPKSDVLIIDEYQDLNRAQQELMLRAGRRIVVVGDPNQAIYGFAGADTDSVPRMKKFLGDKGGLVTLPLTMTYRCGKAIVQEAKAYIDSDFKAHESNQEGQVLRMSYKPTTSPTEPYYLDHVKEGDRILCRINAPLVGQFFRLLIKNIKCKILGKNIGEQLITLIRMMKATTVPELLGSLEKWRDDQIEVESSKKIPNESRMEMFRDQYTCVETIVEEKDLKSIDELTTYIETMFTDDDEKGMVLLSSVHKAKGLEADNVFILKPKGAELPSGRAKREWQKRQEFNLAYVAVTRAKSKLVYVLDGPEKKSK